MAGTFPSVAGCQNVNANGLPLVNATLTVFVGGSLALASVFQDIGLSTGGQNPMTTDTTGRLPFFYVADGVYRVRLVDSTGVLIYDYAQLASIGSSSSGGGGSGVDPTTVFQTGDLLWHQIGGARSGWVRANALTLGSAVSGASEFASSTAQNLFLYLWNNYPNSKCPVVGGRGATAAADWAANKQITLPDLRGRSPAGKDGMGNSRANIIPDGNITSGDTGDTDAAFGGEANHTLAGTEMPSHNHGITDPGHLHGITDPTHNHSITDPTHSHGVSDPTHTHGVNDPTHLHTYTKFNAINNSASAGSTVDTQSTTANTSASSTGITLQNAATGVSVNAGLTSISVNAGLTGIGVVSAQTGIGIQNSGGGAAHNNMPPFSIGTWYIKL